MTVQPDSKSALVDVSSAAILFITIFEVAVHHSFRPKSLGLPQFYFWGENSSAKCDTCAKHKLKMNTVTKIINDQHKIFTRFVTSFIK